MSGNTNSSPAATTPTTNWMNWQKCGPAILIAFVSMGPLLCVSCVARPAAQSAENPNPAGGDHAAMPWVAAFGISALALGATLRAYETISGTSASRLLVLTLIVVAALLLVTVVGEIKKEIATSALTLLGTLAAYTLNDKDATDQRKPESQDRTKGDSG